MIYDYRIRRKELNDITIELDHLSEKQLMKVAEAIKEMKQSENETYQINTNNYFNNAILPVLQDFAEITGSLLITEENNKNQTIEVTFKNSCGFDITESCRYMKILFVLANHISISIEDDEAKILLIFDF